MDISVLGPFRTSLHTYFGQAGGKDDDLVNLAHFLEKVVDAGTLEDVEVMPVIFNLHWNNEIGLLDGLRTEVNSACDM